MTRALADLIFRNPEQDAIRQSKLNDVVTHVQALYSMSSDYLLKANNLSDVASASSSRTNLGLGTSAVVNTGTSGATVPLLNGVNTWSGGQTFVAPVLIYNTALTATLLEAADAGCAIGKTGVATTVRGPATFSEGISATAFSFPSTIVFKGTSGGAASTTGLRLLDTDDSHTLRVVCNSDLTGNRTLRIASGDANRNLDISATDVTVSTAGAALIDDADAAAQRATLGLGSMSTQAASAVAITGGTMSGVVITVATGSFAPGQVYKDAGNGVIVSGITGTLNDLVLAANSGNAILRNPTGTNEVYLGNGDILKVTAAGSDVTGESRCDSFRIDATPSASVATPSTHKLAINCNGTTYYLLLSNV